MAGDQPRFEDLPLSSGVDLPSARRLFTSLPAEAQVRIAAWVRFLDEGSLDRLRGAEPDSRGATFYTVTFDDVEVNEIAQEFLRVAQPGRRHPR